MSFLTSLFWGSSAQPVEATKSESVPKETGVEHFDDEQLVEDAADEYYSEEDYGGDAEDGEYEEESEEKSERCDALEPMKSGQILCQCRGELQKFDLKREEFKSLISDVEFVLIQAETDAFKVHIQFRKRGSGSVLMECPLSNSLELQFNRDAHSMLINVFRESDARATLDILAFVFEDSTTEHLAKELTAVKLFEVNHRLSFAAMVKAANAKEADRSWIASAHEVAEERGDDDADSQMLDTVSLDSDVEMADCCKLMDDLALDAAADGGAGIGLRDADDDSGSDLRSDGEEYDAKKKSSDGAYVSYHSTAIGSKKKTLGSEIPLDGGSEADTGVFNENLDIIPSKNFNRTFVTRKVGDDCALLGYWKHDGDGELQYSGKLRIADESGESFVPYKTCGYRGGHELLLLSERRADAVHCMNLDRGEVVDTWRLPAGGSLQALAPIFKHSDAEDLPQTYAVTGDSLLRIDGRCEEPFVQEKAYKSKCGFSTIASSGHGFVCVGSETGALRLYDDIGKRAKTLLPGTGEAVESVEVSSDSKWILATTASCILVVPTFVRDAKRHSGFRTGFEGRGMGKRKPRPYTLRLKESDRKRIGVKCVRFTAAKWNEATEGMAVEKWIVSSVQNYVIKWNFTALVKRGRVGDYSIRRAQAKVVRGQFRFGATDDLLVSEKDFVYAQHSTK